MPSLFALALALTVQASPVAPAPGAAPTAPVDADEQEFFALFDGDKDGAITRAEFDAFAAKADAEAATADPSQKGQVVQSLGMVFPMMDADKDGRITRPEFRALTKPGVQ